MTHTTDQTQNAAKEFTGSLDKKEGFSGDVSTKILSVEEVENINSDQKEFSFTNNNTNFDMLETESLW